MTLLIGIILGGLAFLMITVKRAYESVPAKELKKRARSGDQIALLLHRAVSYGTSLEVVLWVLVATSAGVFFVYLSQHTAGWFAALTSTFLIWFGFLWMPKRKASRVGLWVAAKISPLISRIVSFLHPVLRRVIGFVQSYVPIHFHTGLYDKEDLVKLLEQQKNQPDNQISESSLEVAAHAIGFGDKLVGDVLVPRRAVKMVHAADTTGPVLMSELHDSGFSRFPVHGDKKDQIVGILYLRDLIRVKSATKVSTKMHEDVVFIHEDQTLESALKAILATHQQLFIVVNSFEEYVGILTIEDVLEQIIGTQIIDEFDQYDDMRAVAARAADMEHAENNHPAETTE